jgi:hypothetical protein
MVLTAVQSSTYNFLYLSVLDLIFVTFLLPVCNAVQENHTSTVPAVHECITNAIGSLLYYPEAFDEVAENLISYLTDLIQDDDSLTVVIDELVDQVMIH